MVRLLNKASAIYVLVLLLFIWLQYQLWFDDTGILANASMSNQISMKREENAELLARNQVLTEEILNFKSGTDSIEAKARKELGMIKQGETFFILVNEE